MGKWITVKSSGEIPAGRAVSLKYRINGTLVNGINGQAFTLSDAERALCDNTNIVEYEQAGRDGGGK